MLRKLVVDRRDFAPFGDRFSGEGTTAVPLAMVAPTGFEPVLQVRHARSLDSRLVAAG
jgi:hypothetical protein